MSPRPAAPWVGMAFGVSAALVILLNGPLILFNPWFVAFEQGRHAVPARLGTSSAEVARVTDEMLGDLLLGGNFAVSLDGVGPLLDDAERSHMRDVGRLVRAFTALDLLAIAVLLVSGWRLRSERPRRARLLVIAASGLTVAAVAIGVFFAVAFDAAFTAFHGLFFAAGTWQFGPDSNLLRLFPEPFWYEIALAAGLAIIVTAVLATLLARRDQHAGSLG
jgi:integral membrane protein (TIGR01906 family)